MQAVSEAYKLQMQKGIRNPSRIEIVYGVFNADATEQAVLSDNGGTAYSSLDIKDEAASGSYITFEPGRWVVGQAGKILPRESADNTGYVSAQQADADGHFESNPAITIAFAEVHNIFGLTFTFDPITGEYPLEIRVNGMTFTPTSSAWVLDQGFDAVDQLVIEFVRVRPYYRARVQQILFGQQVIFSDDKVIKASVTSKVDLLSLALPSKSLSFTIENTDLRYNPLDYTAKASILQYTEQQQPVLVRFGYELDDGSTEWVPAENLILEGSPTTSTIYATFKAMDSLSALDGLFYKGLYRPEGITLYDLAVEVLSDAGVESYVLPDYLKDITTKGALPVVTHKECLQIIANAGECILYTDRAGAIHMDVALDPTIRVSDTGHVAHSNVQSAFNDENLPTKAYIDFLPGSWIVGNDRLAILPADKKAYTRTGFISSAISDDSGTFVDPPTITLKYSFPYSIFTLPLVFDSIRSEYATNFRIVYLLAGTRVDEYLVTGNTEVSPVVEHFSAGFDEIQIQIQKWSAGPRRAVVDRIGERRVNDFTFAFNSTYGEPATQKQESCKSVTVYCYNYAPQTAEEEIYREEIAAGDGLTLEIQHEGAVNAKATFSGGSITAQQHYTYMSIITLSGSGELVISGNRIAQSTTSVVKQINPKGVSKEPLENPLITSQARAAAVATWTADYFAKRNLLTADYRGNPELDVYDLLYMQSQFLELFPVWLMEHTINYNGALSGKVKVVMV